MSLLTISISVSFAISIPMSLLDISILVSPLAYINILPIPMFVSHAMFNIFPIPISLLTLSCVSLSPISAAILY